MVDFLIKIQQKVPIGELASAECLDPKSVAYRNALEIARKEFPALIKRISNKIPDDQKALLIKADGKEFNPSFSYPTLWDLSGEEISRKKKTIHESINRVQSIEAAGYEPTISDDFDMDKALNGLQNLKLLELAQKIQEGKNSQRRQRHIKEFKKLNRKMTGSVDDKLYQGIINSVHDIAQSVTNLQPAARSIANELADKLPPKYGAGKIAALPQSVFNQYRRAYKDIFGAWLDEIIHQKSGLYTAEDMVQVFSNALKSIGLEENGWIVVLDSNVTSMKISVEEQTVSVPVDRKPLTRDELASKLVHEIGHLARGWSGSHISRSAEHGLPDYLDAEEGLMSYGEEFIAGRRQGNVTHVERYIGVGSMAGSIDGREKDFKDVFAIMWRSRVMMENSEALSRGEDISQSAIRSAKENSLMNAQRLFRGGDGATPGLGWTRDKSYYEGTAMLTSFLTNFPEKVGMENLHWLFAAKFDPTNEKHNQYLGLPLYNLAVQ